MLAKILLLILGATAFYLWGMFTSMLVWTDYYQRATAAWSRNEEGHPL